MEAEKRGSPIPTSTIHGDNKNKLDASILYSAVSLMLTIEEGGILYKPESSLLLLGSLL